MGRSRWTRGRGRRERKKMVVVDKVDEGDKVLHFLDKGLQIGQLISAIVTLGLARLGDRGSSLQFGSSLDSHWLGQMTTAGWVIVLCSSLLGRQLGDPPAPWFDVALNICGGILYVTTGSLVVDFYTNALSSTPARDAGLAMASFGFITGCLLLTDALIIAIYQKRLNKRTS